MRQLDERLRAPGGTDGDGPDGSRSARRSLLSASGSFSVPHIYFSQLLEPSRMLSARRRTVLLVLVGLSLVANPAWLYPHDDEALYTYERREIGVEDGNLTYHGLDGTLFVGKYSDLNALGCQLGDTDARACAFDEHLATHGPMSVSKQAARSRVPEFAHLDDGYYRRVRSRNESTVTYDVERVAPREFLEAVAVDLTELRADDLPGDLPLEYRLAVTGGTTRSFEDTEDDELGRVFRHDGSYYTVVVTDQEIRDPPFPLTGVTRRFLQLIGVLAIIGAVVYAAGFVRWVGD